MSAKACTTGTSNYVYYPGELSSHTYNRKHPAIRNVIYVVCAVFSSLLLWNYPALVSRFRQNHIDLSYISPRCEHVPAISASEFLQRQRSLAQMLHNLNASAYVAEPGASSQFYANISGSSWHLSERPLLLIITPKEVNGQVEADVSLLTPAFEATRAKLLPIAARNASYFEWAEDADPYQVVVSQLEQLNDDNVSVLVDNMVRKFIADGIAEAAPHSTKVISAPLEVRRLRERKSPAEIDILKCANEATLFSVREVRRRMYIGMKESEAGDMIRSALSASGLSDAGCLVLFGENAALPHGSGSDRTLGKKDFILFDCDGTLHGYHSDLTRTFALDRSVIPNEHTEIWYIVQAAQRAAMDAAYNGTEAQKVDKTARAIIRANGYGEYFTHRLGHGIGLEVHEPPYLRGGSNDIILTGHTFSNEPGIYIENKVGVRLEDTFYISDSGVPIYLTLDAGGPATSPWMF